jgi:hypothetical protein
MIVPQSRERHECDILQVVEPMTRYLLFQFVAGRPAQLDSHYVNQHGIKGDPCSLTFPEYSRTKRSDVDIPVAPDRIRRQGMREAGDI